jgi:multiple antibiotic resistance protein
MFPEFLVAAFATLLVAVDPVGLAPGFIVLTNHLPKPDQRRVAISASVLAGGILVSAAFGGEWLLRTLSISMPAFRIAGGLLLLWIAFEMVFERHAERQSRTAEEAVDDNIHHIAAFPLAVPLMAGPGAITATVLLADQAGADPVKLLFLVAVIVLVMALCLIVFLAAATFRRALGTTGNIVVSRLLGMILAALAVQFMVDGIVQIWKPL